MTWECTKCGSCCKLSIWPPAALQAVGLDHLVGPDGWCENFDHRTKQCGIYDSRPDVCRARDVPDRESTEACELIDKAVQTGTPLDLNRMFELVPKASYTAPGDSSE